MSAENITPHSSLEYKVPRFLWENLEAVLLANSKRQIGELARRLGVSEKDLQRKVLPSSDSLKVIIQDTQQESNQCKAYVQNSNLTVFCRKPTVYGCEYCAFHRNRRMMVINGTNPIKLQRINSTNMTETMWMYDNTLVNSRGDIVGKINKNMNSMKLFVIDK